MWFFLLMGLVKCLKVDLLQILKRFMKQQEDWSVFSEMLVHIWLLNTESIPEAFLPPPFLTRTSLASKLIIVHSKMLKLKGEDTGQGDLRKLKIIIQH